MSVLQLLVFGFYRENVRGTAYQAICLFSGKTLSVFAMPNVPLITNKMF